MEIPWEDQLSYYSSSINGSLRGKVVVKYKQKWWDIWRTGMRSFTMCCLCFPSALCLVQHLTLCSVLCWSSVFAKELDQGWNGSAVCVRESSHLLGSVLQQHFRASQADAGSQDLPIKRFPFSFHSPVFLGCGSLPGKCFINLRKRYPKVLGYSWVRH